MDGEERDGHQRRGHEAGAAIDEHPPHQVHDDRANGAYDGNDDTSHQIRHGRIGRRDGGHTVAAAEPNGERDVENIGDQRRVKK